MMQVDMFQNKIPTMAERYCQFFELPRNFEISIAFSILKWNTLLTKKVNTVALNQIDRQKE